MGEKMPEIKKINLETGSNQTELSFPKDENLNQIKIDFKFEEECAEIAKKYQVKNQETFEGIVKKYFIGDSSKIVKEYGKFFYVNGNKKERIEKWVERRDKVAKENNATRLEKIIEKKEEDGITYNWYYVDGNSEERIEEWNERMKQLFEVRLPDDHLRGRR